MTIKKVLFTIKLSMENIKEYIMGLVTQGKTIKSADIGTHFGVSRQYIGKILNNLIDKGLLVKVGSTRSAFYVSPQLLEQLPNIGLKKHFKNHDLREHEILQRVITELPIIKKLPDHIQSIFDFAFSEMVNNAIEHSQSPTIEIRVVKHDDILEFVVSDLGIGVFRNIMKKRNLASELEAIQDLLKGKTTTQPQAHSGEGIFFTSKAANVFILESFDKRLRIDNLIHDVFIEEQKPSKRGTRVIFSLNIKSQKHLSDIFKQYTDTGTFSFSKTEVKVKLYTMGTIHISRSQARRILSGLEKFKSVILDFDKVPTIGQAFADEIFRVFKVKHPDIVIIPVNMNEAVGFMIERVEKI